MVVIENLFIFTRQQYDVKHLYLFGLFFSLPFFCFSQGEWNNWVFGKHAEINFTSGAPVPISTVSSLFNEFGAGLTVSDSIGNILFYGENSIYKYEYIYNRNNVRMPNGNLYYGNEINNLNPLFVVPNLTNDSLYYIFSLVNPYPGPGPGGLYYSVLDMRLDGGLGDINPSQSFIRIYNSSNARNVMTGTRHHNNKDAWIVLHKLTGSNEYLSYHISSAGIDTIPVVSQSFVNFDTSSNFSINTLST